MLKITLRNLYREKLYALLNIFGLSLAIACCLILGLYLKSELTYDQHFTKHKQIFRVVNEFNINGKIDSFAITSQSLGSLLVESYPEILDYVRFRSLGDSRLFRHENDSYYWENVYLADDNVFKIFSHDIIFGNPETALDDPVSAAVSESFARKYFGEENPIGKTISDESKSYKIALVFADLPENTHLKYDVLLSFNSQPDINDPNLRRRLLLSVSDFTYLLMEEGYDPVNFKEISDTFFERHMSDMAKGLKASWRCWVQPLADVHFHSKVGYDLVTGNIYYIYGFMAVGIFILLVACINYMNLATARASRRSHEVGMKKILGSGRARLVFQFLGEAIVFLLIALVLGVILGELILTLTPLNELLDKPLSFNPFNDPRLWKWVPALLGFGILMGLLSGIYPAFYLSSVLPLSALVGGGTTGKGNIRFRQVLVLIQFIITVGVIACTIIMIMQMKYVSGKDLGFNKENRLIITLRGADLIEKMPTIKKELLKNGNILGVATTGRMIGQQTAINVATIDNNEGVPEETGIKHISVGEDYIQVMGMELFAGRDFSKKLITDIGNTWVVNEALVKKMGWDQPLGKHINLGMFSGQVRGVVKDFHFASLHSEVEPFGMHQFPDIKGANPEQRAQMQRYLIANIAGKDIFKTLKFLEDKFAEFDPKHPFTYEFMDDSLKKLYLDEQRLMKLTGLFSGVCILISCLGLFGLSSYATEQRTKEIGIRKVLGASTWQIITLLARNILLIVLAGAVIASILAYLTMDEWLSTFAYKTGIEVWVFLLSAMTAAAVAFITVALQSFKVAQSDPVDTIRYE